MTLNFLTFIFFLAGGVLLAARQIVLSPRSATFPCAPNSVRVAMFLASIALVGIALLFYGHGEPYAGRAAVAIAILAGVLAFYNGVMLFNVIAQRYPAPVWARLRRAEETARRPRVATAR